MSRTRKDAPYRVQLERAGNRTAHHYGCQHSDAGGLWVSTTRAVVHEAAWHEVIEYRYPFGAGWVSRDVLIGRRIVRGCSVWWAERVVDSDEGHTDVRTRLVYGSWTNHVAERVFITRACDLDDDSKPRTWRTCRWRPDNWRRMRMSRHHRATRADLRYGYWGPERAHCRVMLAAAAREYRTDGTVWSELGGQQHRHATFSGSWW